MMGGSSSCHWVIVAVVMTIVFWAVGRIAGRLGYSPVWALLLFVPLANVAAIIYLAIARWPIEQPVNIAGSNAGDSGR
jgi:hypothetical protein